MKNLKTIIGIVVVISIVVISLLAYSLQTNKTNGDSIKDPDSFISKWGKRDIVVGLDQEYPPITFRDEKGELVGFDIDLAKEAFRRIGLNPVFKPIDWSTIILSLNKKDIDVIWSGMSITDERKQQINFTEAYFKGPYIYLIKDDSAINSKDDLIGKVIGVQAGSSNEEALKIDPIASKLKSIKSYSSFQESLLDLDNGRIDAVYGDSVFAYYYINSKGFKYKTIEEQSTELGAGVGIRKADTALLEILDKTLNDMKQDGTATKISIQWFGKDMITK